MKLTVLIDNNTLIDQCFIGEPTVSYFMKRHPFHKLMNCMGRSNNPNTDCRCLQFVL